MAKIKGDQIRFYNDSSVLALELDVVLSGKLDTIETTNKDSVSWKTYLGGQKSWTCACTAHLDWSETNNISQIYSDFSLNTFIGVDVGAGSSFYSGVGLISRWSFSAPKNEVVKFKFSVIGTGPLILSIGTGFPYPYPYILS